MKHIDEYLVECGFAKAVFLETMQMVNEEAMVSEAFKSSILTSLAKEISKVEKDYNKREAENADRLTKEYGYKHTPRFRRFSTFFGPVTVSSRYGGTSKKTQGVKWADITDEDFKMYTGDDKELAKLVKQAYGKKINADFICCEKGTKKPVYVIQAYKKEDERTFWQFKSNWGSDSFSEKTAKAYKYSSRPLKADEALELIKDLDVYVLVVTADMTKEYNEIVDARKEAQKGMVNFDKESLSQMLKEQQARYKTLVKEIKAKKLMEDPNILFEEINTTHNEAVNVLKQVMSKPEYMDKFYDAGDIMRTMSYCYEEFYKYAKSLREGDKGVEYAKAHGETEENAKKWRRYDDERAASSIRDAKKYLEEMKKKLESMKAEMSGATAE